MFLAFHEILFENEQERYEFRAADSRCFGSSARRGMNLQQAFKKVRGYDSIVQQNDTSTFPVMAFLENGGDFFQSRENKAF